MLSRVLDVCPLVYRVYLFVVHKTAGGKKIAEKAKELVKTVMDIAKDPHPDAGAQVSLLEGGVGCIPTGRWQLCKAACARCSRGGAFLRERLCQIRVALGPLSPDRCRANSEPILV